MNKNSEEVLNSEARKISIKEGSSYSLMDGFGLRFITPYALALGSTNSIIGFLSSVPHIVGSLSQIPGSKSIEKIPRKKIVATGVLLQALMWLPLIFIGYLFFKGMLNSLTASVSLVVIYTIFVAFGSFVGPAWSSWMKDIVGENKGAYFGRRNKIVGLVVLVCMLIAGYILDFFKDKNLFLGFLILFSIAFIGRALSFYFFTKQYEPKLDYKEGYYFSFFSFVKKMPSNNFGKFVLFSSVLSFGVAIASPFFSVYMLKELNFSYAEYTLVSMVALVITIFCMPLWGKIADKYGTIKVIKSTGFFVTLVPLLWFFTPMINRMDPSMTVPYLILVELFSGFWWSGLNLSTANFVYDAVTRERMGICVAYSNILGAFGAFFGAILGGFLSSIESGIFGIKAILFVFLLSGLFRLLAVVIFLPQVKEVRKVDSVSLKALIEKIMIISPRYLLDSFNFGVKRAGFHN